MSSVPLILFASTSARAKDALADVNVALSTLLTREVKTLQGHVIFTVDGAASTEVIAAQLLTCGTLDHVNVQLASCALNEFEGGALAAIRAAASAVTPAQLEAALELWRAVCRVAADGREAAAALPTAALVFRAIGKRGGRGHTFSSDDAKRAAKQGLTAASGLNGSTSDYHFDIVAQQYQEVEEAEVVVEQLEKLPPREQELCEPLRYHGASGGVPQRNVCDFHIGLDRSGLPCCGFRLGVGAAADGVAVAPPTGVCIVPAWMVAVAAEVSTALREWAAADATVASEVAAAAKEAPRLPFAALKLRGSRYTREAMAVLTAVEASDNEGSSRARERSLAACLVEAAAGQNHRLTAVLIKEASSGTLRPVETDASATAAEAPTGGGLPSGSLLEQLSSGLRLRVSPLSFFQASTDASEALFATIAELATPSRHYPSVLLDLCCGGGAIGLEIARAAAASGACTRVIGIESCAAAVDDARANAVLNGLSPPAYVAVCAKVEDAIEGDVVRAAIASASTSASSIGDASGLGGGRGGVVAVLDPPRTGVHPSVCKALRASPEVDRIVFVSCNPHGFTLRHDYVVKGGSLAANARLLCGKGRGAPFCLSRAIPVDLFPHTPHCELCLLFERRRL